MNAMRGGRKGFTIVELLVVISVIALLMAVLLPALSGARKRARKVEEASRIRQVGEAWLLYSNGNNDAALPGFVQEEIQSDGEKCWDVSYKLPDKSPVPAADAEEWPWRLLPYLSYNHDVLHGYLEEAQTSQLAMVDHSDQIAEHPAFGYNAYYIGGWWEMKEIGGVDTPRPRFFTARMDDRPISVLVRSPSSIQNPTKLVLFCSTAEHGPGYYHRVDDMELGSHYAAPSFLAEEEQWKWATHGGGPTPYNLEVVATRTAIPIGRYTGQAAVLHADLHYAPQIPGELIDQRFWINTANTRDYRHQEE